MYKTNLSNIHIINLTHPKKSIFQVLYWTMGVMMSMTNLTLIGIMAAR